MRRRSWRVVAQTFGACLRYRVTGLAAEAAFFALLSLPPLIFGLAGAIGFVAQRFDVTTVAEFRTQVLDLASRLLTPTAVDDVIAPTLDDVLFQGRFEIISIGFVIALWSGSRAVNVRGRHHHDHVRAGRAAQHPADPGAVVLPVRGVPGRRGHPAAAGAGRPGPGRPSAAGPARRAWPTSTGRSCSSARWRRWPRSTTWPCRCGPAGAASLPGAALTLLLWLGGSALLRLVLGLSIG